MGVSISNERPESGIDLRIAASPADYAVARILILEYADWLGVDLGFQGFDDEIGDLAGVYGPPDGRLFLAFDADVPAGCVGLRPLAAGGEAEMKRLFVRPDFRGRGVASRLVQAVIDAARQNGVSTLRLDTWPPRMAQADAMYRRLGFVPTPPYYNNPVMEVVFYALALDPPAQESGGGAPP
ncbi:MAG: GNAT family N-acetyltransferase [Alphaproteobacteria bacterium]|nr:GNAT family N-acetyltransferase [Alphaproteobacteria bacterium]